MKKIFIYLEACKRRAFDAIKIKNYFLKNGHEIVNKPENADYIIFFTCAFKNEMAELCLNILKEFQQYDAELIVAGCLPGIEKVKLAEIFDGKTINTKELDEIDILFPENKIKFKEIDDENILDQVFDEGRLIGNTKNFLSKIRWLANIYLRIKNHVLKCLFGEQSVIYSHTTTKPFFIRIAKGCLGNCSYCAIKKGIGPLQSKSLHHCINEFKKGLKGGYDNFHLLAGDTGAYGLDIGSNFPELLDNITKIPGEYKISIGGLNPRWLVKYINELEEILKRNKILVLGIPLQSGSSRILKLMLRYHATEKIRDALLRLKTYYPDLTLSTSCIVGFPTESKEDFIQTLDLIKKSNYDNGALFPFSCKTGTEAEKLESKISKKEMLKRLKFAKKYLKKAGYHIFYVSKPQFLFPYPRFIFYKRNHNKYFG